MVGAAESAPRAGMAVSSSVSTGRCGRTRGPSPHVLMVVAAPAGWEEPATLLAEELGCGKVVSCLGGGSSRAESVRLAIAAVPEDAAVVLVHDAARPLLPGEVVERVLAPLSEGWDGVVPA